MSQPTVARFWFRLALPTGERCTVWTTTERGTRAALASWRRQGVRIVTRGTRRPPQCGDPSPPETPRARIGPYRCTLTVGHDGEHVMTRHPLHPAWPQS